MALQTIAEPSADQQQLNMYNTKMKRHSPLVLTAGEKYAACRLRLAPAVTQGDYPTLKAAIEAITGIQEAQLLIDGQCPAGIPADKELRLICEVKWFDDYFNTRTQQVGIEVLGTDQKFVVATFRVAGTVQRSDYPTLKTAVEGVTGIQACAFFADCNFADATVCRVDADVHLRIDDEPEP